MNERLADADFVFVAYRGTTGASCRMLRWNAGPLGFLREE